MLGRVSSLGSGQCFTFQSISSDAREDAVEFNRAQRMFYTRGLCLVGFDSFDSGEELHGLQSLVAVAIGLVRDTTAPYVSGGFNQTDLQLEQHTKQLLQDWQAQDETRALPCPMHGLEANKGSIRGLLELVSRFHVPTDSGCSQNQVSLLDKDESLTLTLRLPCGQPLALVLLGERFFGLRPADEVRAHSDERTDLHLRIAQLASQMQSDRDLFDALCHLRYRYFFAKDLPDSKTLAADYKKEMANLFEIKSISDFNTIFCSMLDPTRVGTSVFAAPSHATPEDLGGVLFWYLAEFKRLNDSEHVEAQERMTRLKVLKAMYSRALLDMIRKEQERRKNVADRTAAVSAEEEFLNGQINSMQLVEIRGPALGAPVTFPRCCLKLARFTSELTLPKP